MNIESHQFKSHCPINFAQEIFGDRWCLLIIRDLMFKGKRFYGEFLESSEKISTNILANRLTKLQNMGLINKSIDSENNSRYIYALTQKGIDLLPMLLEMIVWGAKYDNDTDAPTELVQAFKKDREKLIMSILEKLVSEN